MKILVYSSVFYPNVGGIENLNLDLINEFTKNGHEVKVITEQKQTKPNPFENVEIVEYKNILSQIRLFFWCDLVYMPNITLKGFWLFLFNPFKKLVISHNDFHIAFHKKWKAKLKLFFINLASANIAVSKSIADHFNFKAEVIYNCYNDSVFKLYPDVIRNKDFIFVGRLVSSKGGVDLLEAFNKLENNYTLTYVGDGPELVVLQNLTKQYGLENRINFLGFMHGEALARTINEHKIMVICPTSVEGFGLVALEGLACGCELIVSEAGGLTEAANGFGCQFPMKDINALYECMKKTIESENLNKFDERKTNYLQSLTKESVAANYIKVFEKIIN